ncbi:MAG: hypothetical protein AAGA18_14090 [Verrucomicrobiota bacterium]
MDRRWLELLDNSIKQAIEDLNQAKFLETKNSSRQCPINKREIEAILGWKEFKKLKGEHQDK